jgi:hypothetical protein
MSKSLVLALVAAAAVLTTGAAQAHGVSWSIGIDTPVIGTVISNAPAYPAYPVYPAYRAAYAPVPQVVYPAPVIYQQSPGYYRAAPVVVEERYHPRWHHRHERWEGRGWRRD